MTAYQEAQEAGQSAVRATILDAATHLLVAEGLAALTVRGISARVGCSTKVIYTMFGGKDGLIEALLLEGFGRFGQALTAVPENPDPLFRLGDLGVAYRAYALAEPDYYRVMFQTAVPGFRPTEAALMSIKSSFRILVDAVDACLQAGRLVGGDAREIADIIWMATHGAVSLEISGFFSAEEAERRFALLTISVLTPYLPPEERTSSWTLPTEAGSHR